MSVVVRLPEDIHTSAKQAGSLQGRSAAEMMSEAWREYLAAHRDELASDFEEAAELLRSGDTEALARFANRSVVERAEAAAERIHRK
jgi:hypothetical protein